MAIFVRARERPQPRTGEAVGSAVAAAVLFSTLQTLQAPFGLVLGIFSAFPVTLRRIKGGLGGALLTTFLASALLATWSPAAALGFLLLVAAPGLLVGDAMARGRGLLRGCLWAFGLLTAEISVMLLFEAPQMAARVIHPFVEMRSPQYLNHLRFEWGLSPQAVDEFAEQASFYAQVVPVVYPALYIIFGAITVLANAALLRAYLVRRDPGWLEGGEFEGIRWPLALTVVFVLAGLAVSLPSLRTTAYNVLLLLAFFFLLQGLAVVAYFAHRLAGPSVLRLAVLFLVLANPWAKVILPLLGLFDTFFDFRKYADVPSESQ